MPKTTITFNGLLVFRPDPANNLCEVGILRAREAPHSHILQIQITPNPVTGQGTLRLDPDLLESHVQNGRVSWQLDVALNGQTVRGIELNNTIPADRHEPTQQNREDFGWIVNLEGKEFHHQPLERLKDGLQPVITLTKGRLFNSCMTDAIDLKQGRKIRSNFGFILGGVGLAIDTSAGETPVLIVKDRSGAQTNLFSLVETRQRSYDISIMNTPLSGKGGGHFHLYYDKLFTHVDPSQRFDVIRHTDPNPIAPPFGRCPEVDEPTPDPFKCGGIAVENGSGPLG